MRIQQILVRHAHVHTISLARTANNIGRMFCTSLYSFILPIALSTWIHNAAICLVCSPSLPLNCSQLSRKGGLLIAMPLLVNLSNLYLPYLSPCSRSSNSPDDSVIAGLIFYLPTVQKKRYYSIWTNSIILKALWYLQCENVSN